MSRRDGEPTRRTGPASSRWPSPQALTVHAQVTFWTLFRGCQRDLAST